MKSSLLDPLKTLMLKMRKAAIQGDWAEMEMLDDRRAIVLDCLTDCATGLETPEDEQVAAEIVRLDQEILQLTQQQLELVAAKVTATSEKTKACSTYQSHAGY